MEDSLEKQIKSQNKKNIEKEDFKAKSKRNIFDYRQLKNSKEKNEVLVQKMLEDATNISTTSPDSYTRIKAELFNIVKRVGPNLYLREIKKTIKSHEKQLNITKTEIDNYQRVLYGENESSGLIKKKEKLQDLANNIFYDTLLHSKDIFEKIDEKIEYLEDKINNTSTRSKDEIKSLKIELNKMYWDRNDLKENVEENKEVYEDLTFEIKEYNSEIQDYKEHHNLLKKSERYLRSETNSFKRLAGSIEKVGSLIYTASILNKNFEISNKLSKVNESLEEKSYTVREKIKSSIKTNDSHKSKRTIDYVKSESRLKDKQSSEIDIEELTKKHDQLIRL